LIKHQHVFWVGVLVLLGAGLRFHSIATPELLWDEGWTLGLSGLSLSEIDRITALDVHPPLYYLLMKLLLPFGKDEFWLRLPSIFAGILAIPLTYAVGVRWADRRTGIR